MVFALVMPTQQIDLDLTMTAYPVKLLTIYMPTSFWSVFLPIFTNILNQGSVNIFALLNCICCVRFQVNFSTSGVHHGQEENENSLENIASSSEPVGTHEERVVRQRPSFYQVVRSAMEKERLLRDSYMPLMNGGEKHFQGADLIMN